MSCNCTTAKQINELYEAYGEKVRVQKQEKLSFKIKYYLNELAVRVEMLYEIPRTIFYVLFKILKGENKISIAEFLKLK